MRLRRADLGGSVRSKRKLMVFSVLTFLVSGGLLVYQSAGNHDVLEAQTVNGGQVSRSGWTSSGPAKTMSAAQMSAFSGAPSVPAAGLISAPTIPLDQYNALKAMSTWSGESKSQTQSGASATVPLAPVLSTNFQGAVQGENGQSWIPPDVDDAVGPSQILQTTNASLDIYNKSGLHLRSTSLNGFVGNFTDALGDSRAMYDPNYNRWVVLIDDFSNLTGSGKPQYYIAVSQTGDATGAWFVLPANFNITAGSFFDYPELGMDQDSLLLTVNMFNNSTGAFIGPFMWAIPKAKVYNGLGFGVPVFSAAPGTGTIAPPFVLDASGIDYFLAAPVGTAKTALLKFTMTEAGRSNVAVSGPASITVSSYTTPPPNAKQPCTGTNTALTLDSLDGRFQNRSYQYGTTLWQTHTVTTGSFPIPRFYQLNVAANTTTQSGFFDLSSTSYDLNPHIAANTSSSAMVTWSATDPSNNKNVQVMFGGRTSATAVNTMPVGGSTASSTTCLVDNFQSSFGHQRWGDYSVVNLDSSSPTSGVFWITNEKVIGNSSASPPTDIWATQISRVTP